MPITKKIAFFISCNILFISLAFSQNQIETLYSKLESNTSTNAKVKLLDSILEVGFNDMRLLQQTEKGQEILDFILTETKKINQTDSIISDLVLRANFLKGSLFMITQNYKEAIDSFNKIIIYSYSNKEIICKSHNKIAKIYAKQEKFSLSIEHFIKAKKCGANSFSESYALACIGLGNIYNVHYDTYEAVNHFKEGINHMIIHKVTIPELQIELKHGIAQTLINEGEIPFAIALLTVSHTVATYTNNILLKRVTAQDLIYTHSLQQNKQETDVYIEKLATLKKLSDTINVENFTRALSSFSDKDYEQAKIDIENIKDYDSKTRERILKLKQEIAFKSNDKNAIKTSLLNWVKFKDSIKTNFYKNFTDSLQVRNQKRAADELFFNSKTEQDLNESEIQSKKNTLLLTSISIIIILIICIILFFTLKKTKKQKEVIESLQKELHHRVKNNLSIIDTFIEVAKEEFADGKFSKKLTELQNRINSINEVHQQLYKNEDVTNLNLKKYIDTLSSNVANSFSNENISIEKSVQGKLNLHADKSFPIGLIINEFLTNSYKYAFGTNAGIVKIEINDKGNTYELALSDNGKGLPENFEIETSESFGLRIIKLLAEQLNGNFALTNNNGVALTIKFPK
jgi:two-component sensor histidine kinase